MNTPILGTILVATAAAQTYPVAGLVADGRRNVPVERVRVTLCGESGGCRAATTAADGGFRFDVPEGKYSLIFERNQWRMEYGSHDPYAGFGSAIIAGPGLDTAHLAPQWNPPGAIFGTITGEDGEPVRDAVVQSLRSVVRNGRKRLDSMGTLQTDDCGRFRLGPLPAGTYYVEVLGGQRPPVQADGQLHRQEDTPPQAAFAPTYYPGAVEFRNATPMVLKPGAQAQADIVLRNRPLARVHVRCPAAGVEDENCPGMLGLLPLGMEGLGDVPYSAVAPGRYSLRFKGEGRTAYKVIDVGSDDVTVDLEIQAEPVVSGKIAIRNPSHKPSAPLSVCLEDETTGAQSNAATGSDGAFQLAGLSTGRYRALVCGVPTWFIDEMSVEGAPFKDGVLELTGNAVVHLSIVASDETGRLKGFAVNGDTPVPGVLVILTPRNGYAGPLGFQTESDGSFDYGKVPAGDYLLYAVDKLDYEFANPEVTRPFLAGATAVHVPAHGVVEQRVPVMAIGDMSTANHPCPEGKCGG